MSSLMASPCLGEGGVKQKITLYGSVCGGAAFTGGNILLMC